MVTQQNYGLWISVPNENGYDVTSFKRRVLPHLQQMGIIGFVPEISKLKDVNTHGTEKLETEIQPDGKHFGIILEVNEELWEEAERTFLITEGTLQKMYGLEFDRVQVKHEEDHSITFIREPQENLFPGSEGNPASRL